MNISQLFLIFCTIGYIVICIDQLMKKNYAVGFMYFGYFIANIAIFFTIK